MSCCGNKRAQLKNQVNNPAYIERHTNKTNKPDKGNKLFKYTGTRGKVYYGKITGNIYRFRYSGDVLIINVLDAYGMMAENDLVLVKGIPAT